MGPSTSLGLLAASSAAVGGFVRVESTTPLTHANTIANMTRLGHSRLRTAAQPPAAPHRCTTRLTEPTAEPYIPQQPRAPSPCRRFSPTRFIRRHKQRRAWASFGEASDKRFPSCKAIHDGQERPLATGSFLDAAQIRRQSVFVLPTAAAPVPSLTPVEFVTGSRVRAGLSRRATPHRRRESRIERRNRHDRRG